MNETPGTTPADLPITSPDTQLRDSTDGQLVGALADTIAHASFALRNSRAFRTTGDTGLDPSLVPVASVLTNGPARVGEVADALHGDLSTVSRQVSHLVSEGFAAKDADPNDRRVVRVSLTPEGHDALHRVRQARRAWATEVVADWSPEDVEAFQSLLTRLLASAQLADEAHSHTPRRHQPTPRLAAS